MGGAYYLNVTFGGNVVYSTRMQGDYSSNGVALKKDDDGSTIAALGPVCFLGGSLIQTPTGEVVVEDLRAGDKVVVIRDGTEQVERLNWVGRKKVQVRKGPYLVEAGYPVRICEGAVSERVPHTDLLLTPEHCLYLNGVFIPVRMLVNGGSIAYATDITSYDYYHVETANHDVIVTNGLTTESYLDTRNRNSFAQHLHLETRSGQHIAPMRQVGGRLLFSLPTGTCTVRLVSRASRLCDSVGPYLDDRRMLGVLTRTIRLWDGEGMQDLMARQPADAEGWYPADLSGIRWTNGNALLALGARSATDAGVLEVEILEAGPYVKPQAAEKRISLLCA
ncbi:Hint domain-containing protein [Gluconobacter cerinus]|uniref:Hint domain-containing protein n=1 Tax=Gluconobacter cerinus TaxID=38307 RepID=UPI0031FF271E